MHISELVLPEWARLRTFLKGIVTVTHSLISGLICYLIHFLSLSLSLPFCHIAWSGCKGYFKLWLLNRWLKTHLQAWMTWFYSQNTTFFVFMTFFFLFYRPDSISHCMREERPRSELVLEIKTNINLSVAHLSQSIMLSCKWQSCGLTFTSYIQ